MGKIGGRGGGTDERLMRLLRRAPLQIMKIPKAWPVVAFVLNGQLGSLCLERVMNFPPPPAPLRPWGA